MINRLCDLFIIAAVICIIFGIITRILLKPFFFGITAQAYVQFSQLLLLFAIALGVREFNRVKK